MIPYFAAQGEAVLHCPAAPGGGRWGKYSTWTGLLQSLALPTNTVPEREHGNEKRKNFFLVLISIELAIFDSSPTRLWLYLVLFVFLGQSRKVPGYSHDNSSSLWLWQEGEESGNEAFPLAHRHDHQALLIAHSARGWKGGLLRSQTFSIRHWDQWFHTVLD